MITFSDTTIEPFPVGAIWAIASAGAYALYLVTLKKKVKDDEQLDVPMFFGKLYRAALLVLLVSASTASVVMTMTFIYSAVTFAEFNY